MSFHFQRARRPEQIQARREAILRTAAQMLTEMPVADISLNELSRRVGLAKSNVLRYFETREAIFLELLDSELRSWLAVLSEAADPLPEAIADTLVQRPLLCELVSVGAGVLERNVSTAVARQFKLAVHSANAELAQIVKTRVPQLDETAALYFGAAVYVIVAGLWPLANPSASVLAAYEEDPSLAAERMDFRESLTLLLSVQLAGHLSKES